MKFSHELSVGNRAIDSEHQKLQDTINKIASNINALEVAGLSETFSLLAETFLLLEQGLHTYFAVEESIAEALHFDFAQHRLAHQRLLKVVRRMRDVSMARVGM